jgi:hypothetical protein
MTQGFIVCQPYASQIIHETKKEEFRTFRTIKLEEPIYLLSEGYAHGLIEFLSIREISFKNYAWEIKVLEKFKEPIPYKRKPGQQIWVKNVKLLRIS